MKTLRFILALVILLGPAAGARAQVVAPQRPRHADATTCRRFRPREDVVALRRFRVPTDAAAPTLHQHQGVLVETARRATSCMEQAADQAYNPASAVKLAPRSPRCAPSAPKHRFATAVWINGTFDKATGTVTGDLIISGRDPSFHYEHAVAVARELNQLGIRTVTRRPRRRARASR